MWYLARKLEKSMVFHPPRNESLHYCLLKALAYYHLNTFLLQPDPMHMSHTSQGYIKAFLIANNMCYFPLIPLCSHTYSEVAAM